MNTTSLIGWSIVIAAILGLIIYQRYRNKQKANTILKEIKSLAEENNIGLDEFDHWTNTSIGIDYSGSGKLLYIRNFPTYQERTVIDLAEVTDCRWIKSETNSRYKNENINTIDIIQLRLSLAGQKTEKVLELYNAGYDRLTLTTELTLSRKWYELLKVNIEASGSKNKNIRINSNQEGNANLNSIRKVSKNGSEFHRKTNKNRLLPA